MTERDYVRDVAKQAVEAIGKKATTRLRVKRTQVNEQPWRQYTVPFQKHKSKAAIRAMANCVAKKRLACFKKWDKVSLRNIASAAIGIETARGVSVRVVSQYRIDRDEMVYSLSVMGLPLSEVC